MEVVSSSVRYVCRSSWGSEVNDCCCICSSDDEPPTTNVPSTDDISVATPFASIENFVRYDTRLALSQMADVKEI